MALFTSAVNAAPLLKVTVPVLSVPGGGSVQDRAADVSRVFDTLRSQLPQARVVDQGSTGDAAFVTSDGRTAFGLVQGPEPQGFGPGLEAQLEPPRQLLVPGCLLSTRIQV